VVQEEIESAEVVEETTRVELVEKKGEEEEDTSQVIVPQYEVSHPVLLEALLAASDILEGVTAGSLPLDEALKLYKERVVARVAELARPVTEKKAKKRLKQVKQAKTASRSKQKSKSKKAKKKKGR